jgi:metallophosphoesterase superfamily enzyme
MRCVCAPPLSQLANHFCVHHDVYVIVGNHGPMIEQLDARVNVIIIEHLVGPIDFKQDINSSDRSSFGRM